MGESWTTTCGSVEGAAASLRPAPPRREAGTAGDPRVRHGPAESCANLDRIADSRFRLLVEILIRTGLRIGDATRRALDCLVRDPARRGLSALPQPQDASRRGGAHRRRTCAMVAAQQARTRQRFPTTGVLSPRSGANPNGRLPIPTATFHLRLGQWLETCGITDELGQPVHVTGHQFRHT